ncbi:MAG: AbrB/MazE/SpoVT family DNA-binding domain-containing protein [Candidatus Asgardarchaeum sp.]
MEKIKYKFKVKVLSGYRIVIPKQIRDRLGIKQGDELELEVSEGNIIIKITGENPVFMMGGLAEGAPTDIPGDDLFIDELKRKVVK